MKSDNLKESRNNEDRRGQSVTPVFRITVTLWGHFYNFCYRLESFQRNKTVNNPSSWFFQRGSQPCKSLLEWDFLSLTQSTQVTRTNKTYVDDADQFISKVPGTTEDHWAQGLSTEGRDLPGRAQTSLLYRTKDRLVSKRSAGLHCPGTRKIYLDMSFYKELMTKVKYKASSCHGLRQCPRRPPRTQMSCILGNTIVCAQKKDLLKRNEMPSASASAAEADYLAGVQIVPFKTETFRISQ